MENAIGFAVAPDTLSIVDLILEASLLVQLVMLTLLLASLISWTMIFHKWISLRTTARAADDFEDQFWSGGDLNRLYTEWSTRRKDATGISSLFVAGFREYTRLQGKDNVSRLDMVDGVQRSMRVALAQEIDSLETNLSFLATVGSTSPYIGLFGTVWGIMNSFRALGAMQQATIATVAPGIAEALIATAMGLAAAIPAVIAYNRFSNDAERLVARYETFMEEFVAIVNRQSIGSRAA
jgi:biopolymer transport protein TolQ